jgi:hypothetical protein
MNILDKDEELKHDRLTLANKACTYLVLAHVLHHDCNLHVHLVTVVSQYSTDNNVCCQAARYYERSKPHMVSGASLACVVRCMNITVTVTVTARTIYLDDQN